MILGLAMLLLVQLTYYTSSSLVPSFLSRTRREGVWTNMYRACVARATYMYSAHQSDAWIKPYDCAGMNEMHINDCVRVRTQYYPWYPMEC